MSIAQPVEYSTGSLSHAVSGRPRGGPVAGTALITLLALALLALLCGPAQAKLSAVGPVDSATSFPSYYQDSTGMRLSPCLDGPPLCFASPSDLVAPNGEAFYNNATANLTTRNNGKAAMVLALEAAYAGGGSGQEITFARVRFTDSGGLVPGATYTVTHPFGTVSFVANRGGPGPKNAGTQDGGGLGPCPAPNAHAPSGACDFGEA